MTLRAILQAAGASSRRRPRALGFAASRGLRDRLAPRAVFVAAAVVAASFATAQPAGAEEQPSIVKAYGLDWIQHVREEAWPDPKERRPVICLLDTGVAITPDTPEDSPQGPIVARLALDGGTGLPQGDTWIHRHGTDMASVIAAPRNDYGTVGVFPQARIVSVRVTEGDETYITPAAVTHGVRACKRYTVAAGVKMASVVMAESNFDQRPSDAGYWETAARQAQEVGAVFVAAAGNSEEAGSVAPYNVEEIATIAAGSDYGDSCWFAPAPKERELRGPGCSSLGDWPAGSSAATAAVGALAAALATRDPGTGAVERLAQLRAGVRHAPDGVATIDGASHRNRFVGFLRELGSVVETAPDLAPAAMPPPQSPVPVVNGSPRTAATAPPTVTGPRAQARVALWKPAFRLKWHRGNLWVSRLGRRTKGILRVNVAGQQPEAAYRVSRQRSAIRLRRKPKRVTIWAEGGGSTPWRSLSVRAKVT